MLAHVPQTDKNTAS